MKLAYRYSALAPTRVGAPPLGGCGEHGGGKRGEGSRGAGEDDLQWMQHGAAELAQRAGASGLRAGEDLVPLPLPLLRG
jgi:hypothetical protein